MNIFRKVSFIVICFSGILSGCKNDFEVLEAGSSIPIIQGVLSNQFPNQYIRLEKSFGSESIAASVLAKDSNALYYPNAKVFLTNIQTGITYTLQKVNGTQEGFQRNVGPFAVEPNYIYKLPSTIAQIKPGNKYKLTVDNGENLTVSSETTALLNTSLFIPSPTDKRLNYELLYRDSKIDWEDDPNAALFDINMYIKYREFTISDPTQNVLKTLKWQMAVGHNSPQFLYRPLSFYQYIGSNIPENPGVVRQLEDITLEIISGGKEIKSINDLALANFGITGSQDLPPYSNIQKGLGIFTSKNVFKLDGFFLKPGPSVDSLVNGSLTKKLNFRP